MIAVGLKKLACTPVPKLPSSPPPPQKKMLVSIPEAHPSYVCVTNLSCDCGLHLCYVIEAVMQSDPNSVNPEFMNLCESILKGNDLNKLMFYNLFNMTHTNMN